MKKQLVTLQELISVMDPDLYRHLGYLTLFPVLYLSNSGSVQKKLMASICSSASGEPFFKSHC
jgi:hypothetical protein